MEGITVAMSSSGQTNSDVDDISGQFSHQLRASYKFTDFKKLLHRIITH